ncbi:hypothetical protein COO92_10055 [Thalassospira lohafexi]|uniref:Uncharacterized protein n=1 Tax=Thalassospira lohafexi TaxID=744227 RepID=A0A2N3L5M2_9PROT|nr:hypothetical protein COO92_10055 [Thalassospira lohafexi]
MCYGRWQDINHPALSLALIPSAISRHFCQSIDDRNAHVMLYHNICWFGMFGFRKSLLGRHILGKGTK